jgi:hypothetical protein
MAFLNGNYKINSISIPAIYGGLYGFPKELCA